MVNLFTEFMRVLRTGEATPDIIKKANEIREELALFSENPEEWQDPVCIPVENDLAPNTRMYQGLLVTTGKRNAMYGRMAGWEL